MHLANSLPADPDHTTLKHFDLNVYYLQISGPALSHPSLG